MDVSVDASDTPHPYGARMDWEVAQEHPIAQPCTRPPNLLEADLMVRLDGEMIMVAQDQTLVSMEGADESTKPRDSVARPFHSDIPKMIDVILRLDSGIPLLHHVGIHLPCVLKGTSGIGDDVGVSKMRIRY